MLFAKLPSCSKDRVYAMGTALKLKAIAATAILLTLTQAPPAVADTAEKKEEVKPSFAIGSKWSRGFQRYTGINFLTEVVSNQVMKYVIKKQVGGDVKVRIKTYSLTDLLAGKVKSADILLSEAKLEGVPISRVELNTKTPTWFSLKREQGSYMKAPLAINVEGDVSQKDVTRALASQKVISSLRGLKLDLPGLGEQQLDIIDPDVTIEENQLVIKGNLITRGGAPDTGVPIIITGKPVLEGNQRIMVDNLVVDCPYIVEPEKFASFVEELINPIVDFGRYDRTTHAFRLSKFAVEEKSVSGQGELILVPAQKVAQSK